eukprot:GCRY01002359.1.p1 GENE.GCRY01002359.1~~GCRY01002359.1.p1  ORF type:complete len:289 (+),score=46.73 GCRY01002359.1:172-1038(+)
MAPSIQPRSATFLDNFAAGGVAGVLGASSVFPLDISKTRLQTLRSPVAGGVAGTRHTFLSVIRMIVRQEGPRGLYKGLGPNLIGIIPEKALKLGCNDFFRQKLKGDAETLSAGKGMLAGTLAGLCQVCATNPMEIVKIRRQMSVNESASQIVKELGLRGLYKGTHATLLRDVPFSAVFFGLNGYLADQFADEHGNTSLPYHFLASACGGSLAAFVTTPMDTVKTRFQAVPKPGEPIFRNCLEVGANLVKSEGFMSLFKGAVPRMCVMTPLFGIAILTFELQKKIFFQA